MLIDKDQDRDVSCPGEWMRDQRPCRKGNYRSQKWLNSHFVGATNKIHVHIVGSIKMPIYVFLHGSVINQ